MEEIEPTANHSSKKKTENHSILKLRSAFIHLNEFIYFAIDDDRPFNKLFENYETQFFAISSN